MYRGDTKLQPIEQNDTMQTANPTFRSSTLECPTCGIFGRVLYLNSGKNVGSCDVLTRPCVSFQSIGAGS